MASQCFPEVIPLQTREFSCFFEPSTGFLRRVESSGVEVIRAIYAAVRDKNWDTVGAELEIERLEREEDSFRLSFTARHDAAPVLFSWKGTIEGHGGLLTFRFDGQAQASFLRNRIGLCTLHPIAECAGKACGVQHTDGAREETGFPLFISPHQPFKDIQRLTWYPAPDLRAEIQFEGDVFEMEDQRNWTDASFKTYSTPLSRPFPVEVASGEEIHQKVTLNLSGGRKMVSTEEEPSVEVAILPSSEGRRFPKLGLCVASHGLPLSSNERDRLGSLCLNHLRVDLHFSQASWKGVLLQARDEALAIDARLQCALFLGHQAEGSLREFCETIEPPMVDICLVFHETEKSTTPRWIELAQRELAPHGFRVGAGTNAYFAELNRERPPGGVIASYSINPQVHAFDDMSLFEALEAQASTVESAVQFCDRQLIISPITLRPRFNPNATDPAKQQEDPLSAASDPRQKTLVCAAWTAGSLARLLPLERLESITFYETSGSRGVMNSELRSSNPEEIFPVYCVFEAVAGMRQLLPVSISKPALVGAFAVKNERGDSICIVANLTGRSRKVDLRAPASPLGVLGIDETNVSLLAAGRLPPLERVAASGGKVALALAPYALLKIEFP